MTASIVIDPAVLEAELAAGRVYCPGCGGSLSPWGYAREREVRMLDGSRVLQPRRARCGPCDATHVLLPAWSVPRRRDGAEVIGRALVLKARGVGIGGSPSVWVVLLARSGGGCAPARRAEELHQCGVCSAVALSEELGRPSEATPLQHALDALGRAIPLEVAVLQPARLAVGAGWSR